MTKQDHLELLMLLSALESWSFSFADRQRLPEWLVDNLVSCMTKLKAEVLGEQVPTLPTSLRLHSQDRGDKF